MRGEERRNEGTRRGWTRDGRQRDEGWKVKRQKGSGRRGEGVRDEGMIVSDEEGGWGGPLGRNPNRSEAGSDRPGVMTNRALLPIRVNELAVAEGGRG